MKHRIIPALTFRNGLVVKGKKFQNHRPVGPLVPAVKVHEMRNVDELILLDIGEPDEPDYMLIAEACENCYMPVTVGGGISRMSHIRNLLNNGADKVSICSHTELVKEAAEKFGSQSIVVCINHYGHHQTPQAPFAQDFEQKGAGEIIIQSVERDGTMEGYDLELVKEVASSVSIPVIALGGAGKPEDFSAAMEVGASAAAAGAIFIWTQTTPKDVALELKAKGIPVRV